MLVKERPPGKDGRRWLRRQAEIEAGSGPGRRPSRETVADYLRGWLPRHVQNRSTVRLYRSAMGARIIPAFGDLPLDASLRPSSRVFWMRSLRKGMPGWQPYAEPSYRCRCGMPLTLGSPWRILCFEPSLPVAGLLVSGISRPTISMRSSANRPIGSGRSSCFWPTRDSEGARRWLSGGMTWTSHMERCAWRGSSSRKPDRPCSAPCRRRPRDSERFRLLSWRERLWRACRVAAIGSLLSALSTWTPTPP